jgi:predicted component of type VI protein secretion system
MGEEHTRDLMVQVATRLDRIFNGESSGLDRPTGFVLLVFPFDKPEGARTNYVSNAERDSMLVALKEIVARFEGRVQETGTTRQ